MRSLSASCRHSGPRLLAFAALASTLLGASIAMAQKISPQSDPNAMNILQRALDEGFANDATDHSRWMYKDHDTQPGKDSIFDVVDVPGDSLRRCIWFNGSVVGEDGIQSESERIRKYIHDPSAQARNHKNNEHDDASAAAIMHRLPEAFIWSQKDENPEYIRLHYVPNPDFDASSMEAKVMSKMAGDLVIDRKANRIYSLSGRLTQDVKLGFGLVRLKQGGTFDVERRDVGGGHWQIVEQHTHIDGHALLFKTINQQEDEVKTNFRPSPATSLEDGARMLKAIP